jgi:voltage-gated potassium channel
VTQQPTGSGPAASDAAPPPGPDTRAADPRRTPPTRRRAARSLLSSGLVTVILILCYFVLPLSSALTTTTALLLGIGLVAVSALLVWHLRSILRSPYPRLRAVAALATTVPLFLVLFATAYFVMSRTAPGNFSEPLSRLDSAYFTVTVFATVGFGDITPVTQLARVLVTVQMLVGVITVGVIAKLVFGAVQKAESRRTEPPVPTGMAGTQKP